MHHDIDIFVKPILFDFNINVTSFAIFGLLGIDEPLIDLYPILASERGECFVG